MLRRQVLSALSGNAGSKTLEILRCFSTFGTDLDRWQRRCDRLTQLQRRIRFPRLETITVDGKDIKLPLPAVEPGRSPNQEELEYLAGFFDGDGCVSMKTDTGAVQLVISQNIDSAEVLLLFRSFLGGAVLRHSASTGSRKAAVQWRACGSNMTAAAATLGRLPSVKQAQLLIAMRGTVPKHSRARVARDLQVFKQRQHVPDEMAECSWSYFAGFFDAEGSVCVRPSHPGLRLVARQVNPFVLERLLHFLHANGLRAWKLYYWRSSPTLVCQSLPESKQTLEQLLANGLLVKRKQAELALSLSAKNHLQIRDAISSLKGLQGRYQCLDTDSVGREIQRLQKRLHRLTGPEHAALHSQLEELRAEHKLQKLISRCDLLRKDMRQSLRQGGQVVSPTICPS